MVGLLEEEKEKQGEKSPNRRTTKNQKVVGKEKEKRNTIPSALSRRRSKLQAPHARSSQMQDLALDDSRHLLDLAELCLNRISELCDTRRDQAHFASACRALRETTPRQALVISGPDFTLRGPQRGHWAPEAYFQTPALPAALAGLKMSLSWKDQVCGPAPAECTLLIQTRDQPSIIR